MNNNKTKYDSLWSEEEFILTLDLYFKTRPNERDAKNKKILDQDDYANIKKEIFDDGFDTMQVRRDLTSLIRQRQELDPEEAHQKRKMATVKRLLTTLKSLKKEAELLKLLPAGLIKETASLISHIESEVSV